MAHELGEKKRAKLDFGEIPSAKVQDINPEDVKAATRSAGFRETPKASNKEKQPPVPKRRTRRKTGRTEQFATRLRAETLAAIYTYADRHEITLAETIEHAMAALTRVKSS